MTALAWSDPTRRSAGLCRSRPRPADRGERLARVLAAHAAQAGCIVTIAVQAVEPWSSATFSGSVATLSLAAPSSPALAAWLADLAEADIPLDRDIVADLSVEPAAEGWLLRVLTCADAANG